jgi:ubiquinone biosynthesis UbiH/UbiF/VisC/COQ6 family hydroxylase
MKKDVIIVGAGPAGLSFACSLAESGLNITVIEKQAEELPAEPAYDGREIALTHLSKQLLETMGAWSHIPEDSVSLVKEAKILDGNSPYTLHFDYHEVCDDTLGHMVSNHQIRKALYEEVKAHHNIELLCEQSVEAIDTNEAVAAITLSNGKILSAPLIVAADSRFSQSRRSMGISARMHDFGKTAIVCRATHELPHHETAYECFRYGGTLAMLPLPGNESSVVITVSTDKAASILEQSEALFNADITAQFDRRFGEMKLSSERFSYPLVATYADKFTAERFALIGDAAVGMHPVTAHGFNLGLKGQHILANQIKQAMKTGVDIGVNSVLAGYDRKHRMASKPLYMATNAIVQLYTNDRKIPKLLRKAVLRLGNHLTPARKIIMHQLTETRSVA